MPARRSVEVALHELGLIERTLIIPDWLQRAELRPRVHAGLNKGEARNVPARACFSTGLVKSATVASGSSATRRSELGDGGYPRGTPTKGHSLAVGTGGDSSGWRAGRGFAVEGLGAPFATLPHWS